MKKILISILISTFSILNVIAQNYCSQAETLTINPVGDCSSESISMGADLDDQDDIAGEANIVINTSCASPSGNWNVYWGTFVGNGNAVDIMISTPNQDGVVVVFENTPCGGTMNELSCLSFLDNIGGGLTVNTTNGANYTIAVFRSTGSSSMSGNISVVDNPSGSVYNIICDQCGIYGSAPILSVSNLNTDCFDNSNVVVTDDAEPMPSTPACTTGSNWYFASFTATTSVTNGYLWGKEEDNLSISILEGPCSALTEIACVNSTDEDTPTFIQANTTPGQEYFVLITTNSGMSAANLCIYEDAPSEPTKAFCSGSLSFENGSITGWDASHGAYHPTDNSYTSYVWDNMVTGIPQPSKGEVTSGSGFDPNIGGMLPVVAPGGGGNSFRLGSLGTAEGYGPITIPGYSANLNHAACEVMSFCFTVDASNAGFGYKYAIVMDYSSHSSDLQPKMEVFIEDACTGGSLVPCGQYEHFPNDGNSEFYFVGDANDVSGQNDGLIFAAWTDVATDLTNYIGQDIRVTFKIRDCEGGGGGSSDKSAGSHWAYAYIDTYCTPLDITVPEFCAGSSSIQICGPDGFSSYSWPAGQPGVVGALDQQCITINNPNAGDIYTVNMTSITGCPVSRTITLDEIPAILPPDTTFICSGATASLDVTPTGANGPYTYLWSNGITTSNIDITPAITTTYTVTITNVLGCSSSFDFVVAVNSASNNSESINVCENSSVTYPDGTSAVIIANTTHTSNLTAVSGCDSVIVTTVNMISAFNSTETITICENSSVTYPDGTSAVISANITHTSNLTSVDGCDSTIVTTVNMTIPNNLTETINVCENSTTTYPDGTTEVIVANTTHTSSLTSVDGCDSIIVTTVNMNPIYNLTETINACENSNVTYPDGTSAVITANTTHTSNLTSVDGCDSIIVTTVNMNPIYNLTGAINTCVNSTVTYPDGTIEVIISNTTHTSNLTSVNGCDSIIVTTVTLVLAYNTTENVNVCENSTVTYPDGTTEVITANTTHNSNLSSVTGCDSIVATSVVMKPIYNLTETINACENSNFTYPDATSAVIIANTTHTSNLTSVDGCDSIIVTTVNMNPIYNLTETVNACENSNVTYPDGTTEVIVANTTHTSNLTSVNGCDSIIVTTVNMNPIYNLTETINACENSNVTYPDGTSAVITTNTTHTSNLTSVDGCDSIIVTTVNMISAFNSTETVNTCENSNVTYPDGTSAVIIANTTHTSNLTSVDGCDSIIVTTVNMNPIYNLTETVNACENSNITYPDGTSAVIIANTTYTSNLTSVDGCDSIIVTTVNMNPIYNLTETVNACENSNITYPDGSSAVITANTTYTSNLTSINGCDSIIVTTVNMNPIHTTTSNVTICEGDDYTFSDGTIHTSIVSNESYTSTYTALNGCDSTITTNITVSPIPTINAGTDQIVCNGDNIVLTGMSSQNSTWNNGVIDGVAFSPNTTMTYTVTVSDNNGCTNSDDVIVTVIPLPTALFTADTLEGCNPLEIIFTNLSTGNNENCLWDFGNGITAVDCGNVTTTYNYSGEFDVSLTVSTLEGCTDIITYTDYINIYEQPLASFSTDHQIIKPNDMNVIFTNSSINATNYIWIFGDGSANSSSENPSHEFYESTLNGYTTELIAINNEVCFDTAYVYINIGDEIIYYVPNAFTPDGDEHNNTFSPIFTSGYDPNNYHLLIFNRWGEIIFESYNADIGWDGTYPNNLLVEDGVYVWKIVFKESKTDKKHEKIGHVTLLR